MHHSRIRHAAALALCPALSLVVSSLMAAEYDINWTGTDGYTMTGSFSFRDSLLGTGPITGDDIDSLIIEVFQNGISQGTWSLVGDGFATQDLQDNFNFNFDTNSESFPGQVNANQGSPEGQIWNTGDVGNDCEPVGFIKASFAQAVCVDGSLAGLLSTGGTEAADSPLIATRTDGTPDPALFDVGGTISGLLDGNTVGYSVREVVGGVQQPGLARTSGNGPWGFDNIFSDGTDYAVVINPATVPENQFCTVENRTGTIAGADVDDVAIVCAPRVTSLPATGNGSSATITIIDTDDASANCSLATASIAAPPLGGPLDVEMPFGAIDFEAIGCTGTGMTVEITFAEDISGATYFKFINDAWQPLPDVTISGDTARFSIADNGPFDADPADGVIRDPSGPGFPVGPGPDPDPDPAPDAPESEEAIPTLDIYPLVALTAILALFGGHRLRSRVVTR